MTIAVLMGGPSGEHEISLKSGRGVTEALRRRGLQVEPVIIPNGSVPEASGFVSASLCRIRPEAAFFALHGAFGEDGTVQQLCESLRVPFTGSSAAASRVGIDKAASRRCFEAAGLRVPRWRLVDMRTVETPASLALPAPYPLVVKPLREGSSLGVSLVPSPKELVQALEAAAKFGAEVLIEECIIGREVTVGVLGEEALPVVEIKPHHAFFDFSAKYTAGMTDYIVPAPLEASIAEQVKAAGLAAHQAIGCRHVSRADIILQEDGTPVILEINTIPGFTPTSLLPKAAACLGLSYDDICEQLVMLALSSAQSPLEAQ